MTCQHPGKVLLQQYLEPQKISQNKLARAIKVPPRRINEIIHEKRGISADTAVRLAIYFGGSATYWTHLQAEYEIEKVKRNITVQLSMIQTPLRNESIQARSNPADNEQSTQTRTNSLKKRIMR
jgi:addiction module HigA family antidote